MHWKAGHKKDCHANVAATQTLEETPEQKACMERADRWINAWASTISYCLAAALDLANHEWGRHDTHVYVSLLCAPSSSFLIQPRREVSR